MKKIKIRDEQKGIIFIALIFIIAVGVSVFFSLNLRTNAVKEYLKNNNVLRTLFLIEDDESLDAFDDDADLYFDDVFKEDDCDEPFDDEEDEDGCKNFRRSFEDEE